MKTIVAFLAVLLCSGVHSTPVNSCSNGAVLPDVQIGDCHSQPCTLVRGAYADVTAYFTATSTLSSVTASAIVTVYGMSGIFPLEETNACAGFVNTNCPVPAGTTVEYVNRVFISGDLPVVPLTLEYSLLNSGANNASIACFGVNAQLV